MYSDTYQILCKPESIQIISVSKWEDFANKRRIELKTGTIETGRSSSRPPLGLKRGELYLSPYREEWETLFDSEKKILLSAIGNHIIDIQHVGSTSIPGIPAKPILDLGIAVDEFENARTCIEPLTDIGYSFRGEHGILQRHYFTRGDPTTHHIHMVEESSDEWTKLIRFRDLLRADPKMAEDYSNLKRDLWERLPGDRKAYQAAKAAFICDVLKRADKKRD